MMMVMMMVVMIVMMILKVMMMTVIIDFFCYYKTVMLHYGTLMPSRTATNRHMCRHDHMPTHGGTQKHVHVHPWRRQARERTKQM